jgi:hypothetical protein
VFALSLASGGCKDEEESTDIGSEGGDLPAGSTAIVVILNPVPNDGHSVNVPSIDGSVSALGEAVRLRGLTIEGNVTSAGNNFGMSFTEVRGSASITGNGGAFLRNVCCGQVTIPTDNAALAKAGLGRLRRTPRAARPRPKATRPRPTATATVTAKVTVT